ncbi:hypothetical protein [Planococcus sp. CAU13]|uniref:hypothetical protein n=1 Tax=Planococcus sp. CAU13 TaxID=1541197 RepID=UPI00052FE5FF|nr:hypothetical protein [Planococcus sp. CAU13]
MYKKVLLGAAILFIGFMFKLIQTGDKIDWIQISIFAVVALTVIAVKEWTDIPYDWNKHKNKGKKDTN